MCSLHRAVHAQTASGSKGAGYGVQTEVDKSPTDIEMNVRAECKQSKAEQISGMKTPPQQISVMFADPNRPAAPLRAMMVSPDTGAHLHSPAYWMLRQTDGPNKLTVHDA